MDSVLALIGGLLVLTLVLTLALAKRIARLDAEIGENDTVLRELGIDVRHLEHRIDGHIGGIASGKARRKAHS